MKNAAPDEKTFQNLVLLAMGTVGFLRLWRQNCGAVPIRDRAGRTERVFHAGPPAGAADLSGIVIPEGWRVEIEIKASGGKRTKKQEHWAEFIRASGGVYVLLKYDASIDVGANVWRARAAIEQAVAERRRRAA